MVFWEQLGLLGLALLLGLVIGAEREYEGKAAGMRTHALIAIGSALFVMAGRYGFDIAADSLGADPARIAAQVVSGIGFLGAGVIFFQRNLVFGMTTAASIWVTTAIAMACAAGMPLIAIGVTLMHLVVVVGLNPMERLISRFAKRSGRLQLTYDSGTALAAALAMCTSQGFTVTEVSTERSLEGSRSTKLTLRGRGSIAKLTSDLSQEAHVLGVTLEEL
ncbi:putative Mg2+ transporter-C (MgtC) family protein [Stackebrandtia endophytica]|uniref:Putative Mg2+ transporter-C (MgtC) family protein n=1 Tax=Stackebrandtia endophytica TaxID=1496996 RepID=A0A543ARL5_9ACTN|nr:MgtC/SapB family protein [Stackebrandtia endophytica]TQL75223.1 putative Mg2+ transporter-C (MgtC) family protein [Stackebrandtia endophytica]